MSEVKKLYGGAIYAYIPPNAVDISKLRQVPDTQEVFAHKSSDQSIIFDILEYLEESDEEACRKHFEELIGEKANQTQIKSIQKLDLNPINCETVFYLNGEHFMSKYKEDAKNLIDLHMVLFRYKDFKTDILVTFNNPLVINPESSSSEITDNNDKWTLDQFMKTVQTFLIADFNLFG